MNVHYIEKIDESKGKPEQKFDAAFETIIRIIKSFQRSNKNFILNWAGLKFKNHWRMHRKY
jgi:hypothetical protein